MLYYKIDVTQMLRDKGWTTYSLLKSGIMSQGTYKNIKDGKMIRPEVLERLCDILDLQPGDIVGYAREKNDAYSTQSADQRRE